MPCISLFDVASHDVITSRRHYLEVAESDEGGAADAAHVIPDVEVDLHVVADRVSVLEHLSAQVALVVALIRVNAHVPETMIVLLV